MPGIIVQPQTLFAIGPSRQFGGRTNPAPSTFVGPTLPGGQGSNAAGNGNQPIFKGYVTITENSVDAIEITQQPVQQGAPIADHAFKKPVTFSIQIIFGSGLQNLNPLNALNGGSILPQSLSTIYQNLLALQSSFIPFNCSTPKRTYYNMLFSSLGVTTDKTTENVLSINATFQQIITVPVGVTVVPRSQLSNPGSNGATQGAGTKVLQSALSSTEDGVKALAGIRF